MVYFFFFHRYSWGSDADGVDYSIRVLYSAIRRRRTFEFWKGVNFKNYFVIGGDTVDFVSNGNIGASAVRIKLSNTRFMWFLVCACFNFVSDEGDYFRPTRGFGRNCSITFRYTVRTFCFYLVLCHFWGGCEQEDCFCWKVNTNYYVSDNVSVD